MVHPGYKTRKCSVLLPSAMHCPEATQQLAWHLEGHCGKAHLIQQSLFAFASVSSSTSSSVANPRKDQAARPKAFSEHNVVCIESTKGRRRVYKVAESDKTDGELGYKVFHEHQSLQVKLWSVLHEFLLPQGFPDSVGPQYAAYMSWRAIQYFFGGAISVYTTKCLFSALGVAGKHSGEAAAAVNWVVKEGAGRLGRFLFGRYGRDLDCELKQFRLAGDLIMESGAALELATAFLPKAFLPLACSANVAKNLAAVAACSTRAPVYKTFARANNLADITAKGESVANIADIVGTFVGVIMAKYNLPLVPAFLALSAGYLFSSWQEVSTVELPYFNFARLGYCSERFFDTGQVPDVSESNKKEPLLLYGGHNRSRIVLGATVSQACLHSKDLYAASELFKAQRFLLSYRRDTRKVFIMLKEGAQASDTLKASLSAHLLLKLMDGQPTPFLQQPKSGFSAPAPTHDDYLSCLKFVASSVDNLFAEFSAQAVKRGWELTNTMLNPKDSRLLQVGGVASLLSKGSDNVSFW